jgi:hypothetical protein
LLCVCCCFCCLRFPISFVWFLLVFEVHIMCLFCCIRTLLFGFSIVLLIPNHYL